VVELAYGVGGISGLCYSWVGACWLVVGWLWVVRKDKRVGWKREGREK